MRSEYSETVRQFLFQVDEEIHYKPMRAAVNEELAAHIEDKAELYISYGVEEKEAYQKAVREMGDAAEIGKQMNDMHHLRTPKILLAAILAAVCVGVLGNLVSDHALSNVAEMGWSLYSSLYFVWGVLLLFLVMRYGYTLILKYAKWIAVFFAGTSMALLILRHLIIKLELTHPVAFSLFNPSLWYGILLLSIPVTGVLMYRRRRQGIKGMLPVFAFLAIITVVAVSQRLGEYIYVPYLTLLLTGLAMMLYLNGKGYLAGERRKNLVAALLGFGAILALWAGMQKGNFKENWQQFLNPAQKAYNAWTDAYNNVLIRELLSQAELLGEIQLSEEELVRYGTSQWYYEDGEGTWSRDGDSPAEYITYRMQFLENPELSDILPQHYHNNYRIAWWVLRYGWLPALLFSVILVLPYALLCLTALRMKNPLGRLTALGSSLALLLQLAFYILGNFGCQLGAFGSLPFVSEGMASITASMLLAGLVLSVYRYDTVVEESKYPLYVKEKAAD